MSQTIHCSLSYHEKKIETLPVFATEVSQGVFGNPTTFKLTGTPAIPFTQAAFNALISNEQTAYAAYKQGGNAQKPAFNIARTALMGGLDKMAIYVDSVANGDANVIILSGFEPTSGAGGATLAKTKATAPQTVKVTNGVSTGEIDAECESFGTGHHYGCIVSEGQALSASTKLNAQGQLMIDPNQTHRIILDLNSDRKKRFTGLTKGTDYYFYFYVVNTGGVSPLSVVVDKMSL